MPNISNYKNHESPLLRAAYWLATLSFEDSANFEVLQSLSKECEKAFQQSFAADSNPAEPVISAMDMDDIRNLRYKSSR